MPQPHQLLTVINKEPDIQLKTLWKLAAEIGCRPNETLAICYDDVDFDNGTIDLKHSLSSPITSLTVFLPIASFNLI